METTELTVGDWVVWHHPSRNIPDRVGQLLDIKEMDKGSKKLSPEERYRLILIDHVGHYVNAYFARKVTKEEALLWKLQH